LVDDYLKSLSPNPERITPALIQMLYPDLYQLIRQAGWRR
jgi:hypothetical protein